MTLPLTTEQGWQAIEKELIAVVGMVTANHEARASGVVFVGGDLPRFGVSLFPDWKNG